MRGVFGGMDAGGIYHAIIGTLEITLAATLISVPIGLLTAIYLVEYGRGHARAVGDVLRRRDDGHPVDRRRPVRLRAVRRDPRARASAWASSARSRCRVLMIPVVVRSCEEMLRLVPNELREAALALGVPRGSSSSRSCCAPSIAGHRHRHHARDRPRHRRDRPAAHHRRRHRLDQLQPVRGPHDDAPGLRLPAVLAGPGALRARRRPTASRRSTTTGPGPRR